jgi:hypothetical protein
MLPHCASSAVPSSTPTWCPQHVLYPQQHFVQRCRPTPAATHPLTTPKVCCKCIAALSFSTTCRCCCSYCNPLQSLHASVLPYALRPTPYALRPTPYALRPTPYALRPTPYALRPMAALPMYCMRHLALHLAELGHLPHVLGPGPCQHCCCAHGMPWQRAWPWSPTVRVLAHHLLGAGLARGTLDVLVHPLMHAGTRPK